MTVTPTREVMSVSESAHGEGRDGQDLTREYLKKLHTGDTVRVTTDVETLDPAAVIATWQFSQRDFDGERHSGDVFVQEVKRKDHTVENPTWKTEHRPKPNGMRVTFQTPDGGRFAAVDWSKTDDDPILYLLVIRGEDPESRRWDRVGAVSGIWRYGEPEDRDPEWFGNLPSDDIPPWEQEQGANPSFQGAFGD